MAPPGAWLTVSILQGPSRDAQPEPVSRKDHVHLPGVVVTPRSARLTSRFAGAAAQAPSTLALQTCEDFTPNDSTLPVSAAFNRGED